MLFMNEFGNFLYSLRKEKGLTQLELAKLLNVTNKAVSKWETGDAMPETSLLLPLSNILNVTVDELLQGKRQNDKILNVNSNLEQQNADLKLGHLSQMSSNKINNENELNKNYDIDYNSNNRNNVKSVTGFNTNNNRLVFGKMEEKTLLEKISGAVCATVVLLGITIYFFIGILSGVWSPYWVIIPVSALTCGIIGIIFDLFNKKKKQQKIEKGENIYVSSACGIVILLCIIVYLLLGSISNLWHPYWIILILGLTFCGITGAFGEVYKYKKLKDIDKQN